MQIALVQILAAASVVASPILTAPSNHTLEARAFSFLSYFNPKFYKKEQRQEELLDSAVDGVGDALMWEKRANGMTPNPNHSKNINKAVKRYKKVTTRHKRDAESAVEAIIMAQDKSRSAEFARMYATQDRIEAASAIRHPADLKGTFMKAGTAIRSTAHSAVYNAKANAAHARAESAMKRSYNGRMKIVDKTKKLVMAAPIPATVLLKAYRGMKASAQPTGVPRPKGVLNDLEDYKAAMTNVRPNPYRPTSSQFSRKPQTTRDDRRLRSSGRINNHVRTS